VGVAWCLTALTALWMLARSLPAIESVVPGVLAIGAAVGLVAMVDAGRGPAIFGIPSLMFALLVLRGERPVLLAAGLVLAAVLAASARRWSDGGTLPAWKATLLLLAGLAPAVALPPGTDGLAAAAIAGGGAIAIVYASATGGRAGVDAVMVAYCVAMVAPAAPLQASLFPLVVASLVVALRRPGPFTAGGFVLLVLAAGKWYLPLLLAAGAGFAARRLRGVRANGVESRAVALPFLSGIPAAPIAVLAVAPDAWLRATRAGTAAAVTAIALAGGSLLVQPSLGTIYALTAIACLLLPEARRDGRWSPALAAFVLAMTGLTGWSGVAAAAFPLPVPLIVVVLLGLAAAIGGSSAGVRRSSDDDAESPTDAGWTWRGFASRPGAAGAIVAGLAAAVVLLHPASRPAHAVIAADVRVPAGQSAVIDLPAGAGVVRLKLSGGNVVGLKGGTVVGIVRAEPSGLTHELRIGDFADWGAGRDEHWLSADNPRPLVTGGAILQEGRNAFLSGTGIVTLQAAGASRLTIEALPALGERGRLLVDAVEVER
jgi:hypothetical protein